MFLLRSIIGWFHSFRYVQPWSRVKCDLKASDILVTQSTSVLGPHTSTMNGYEQNKNNTAIWKRTRDHMLKSSSLEGYHYGPVVMLIFPSPLPTTMWLQPQLMSNDCYFYATSWCPGHILQPISHPEDHMSVWYSKHITHPPSLFASKVCLWSMCRGILADFFGTWRRRQPVIPWPIYY